jgi:putative FmdB family regulatory protein
VPVYEYRCSDCGHQFEVNQRMSDDPLETCEVCGGRVQRVLFAPAIHFKGTGFHNTDYGTKKRPKDGDSNGSSGTASDGASKGGDSGSSSAGDGAAPAKQVKEATPAATAARTTGP